MPTKESCQITLLSRAEMITSSTVIQPPATSSSLEDPPEGHLKKFSLSKAAGKIGLFVIDLGALNISELTFPLQISMIMR